MSNQQVTVTARLKVKPGLENEFKQEFQAVIALTLKEEGCINYDLHQSVEDPSLFLLHENWVSQDILAQHLEQPYIKGLGEKAGRFLVDPPDVRLWQQIANNS
ncbi:antibiotic biosynthesis monooxygenase [Nostoc sp. CHAB 5784]|uniref:Antibiotic biosynthesis monooxygenase n=1 Tax=Nostoc favosum CHAB5714 TaxID=2780399 RepID=A0ABS8IIS9_9NOSO|nr:MULTISPECIES: putative quinol monooxygenase [Nostoc]MCC5603836.1 antibiotic biosynthesis monooxygenase [Nostoc favosum CHAB5714]MCC5663922.1 antibiotic biosynthesis monooxygenase [Nostoc mirabile CHAB5784]